MRTVPATPRLSPSVPFLLRHRARRRGPCHPQLLCYQRRYRFLVIRVTDTVGGRRTTPAVISPCSGTALTRLISRSTPYLTFLQHQHLLSVSARGRSPPSRVPGRAAGPRLLASPVRGRSSPRAAPRRSSAVLAPRPSRSSRHSQPARCDVSAAFWSERCLMTTRARPAVPRMSHPPHQPPQSRPLPGPGPRHRPGNRSDVEVHR